MSIYIELHTEHYAIVDSLGFTIYPAKKSTTRHAMEAGFLAPVYCVWSIDGNDFIIERLIKAAFPFKALILASRNDQYLITNGKGRIYLFDLSRSMRSPFSVSSRIEINDMISRLNAEKLKKEI